MPFGGVNAWQYRYRRYPDFVIFAIVAYSAIISTRFLPSSTEAASTFVFHSPAELQ